MVEGLWVFGHGDRDDAIGVCLRYALSRFGLGASQAWVDGMTGMAFSLPIIRDEDCMAWWMEGMNDLRIDFAANALGLDIEIESVESPKSKDAYLARPRKFWDKIHERVSKGCVVIENTWPLASVIDSWDEEIERPERVTFTGFPLYPNPNGRFYILGKSQNMPDRAESVRQAIEFGLDILAGKHDSDNVKFGDKILEATKIKLGHERFCVPCGNDDFGCFTRTLSRIRGQRLSLAGFANETAGMQGVHTKVMSEMALQAKKVADETLKMLRDPDLERKWPNRQEILSMLPF
jgi:hypothetical protein